MVQMSVVYARDNSVLRTCLNFHFSEDNVVEFQLRIDTLGGVLGHRLHL